jgi:hypothetical protein
MVTIAPSGKIDLNFVEGKNSGMTHQQHSIQMAMLPHTRRQFGQRHYLEEDQHAQRKMELEHSMKLLKLQDIQQESTDTSKTKKNTFGAAPRNGGNRRHRWARHSLGCITCCRNLERIGIESSSQVKDVTDLQFTFGMD